MKFSDLNKLSDLLVKVANAPMSDAVFALGQARNLVYIELIKQKLPTHGERVEARQKQNNVPFSDG